MKVLFTMNCKEIKIITVQISLSITIRAQWLSIGIVNRIFRSRSSTLMFIFTKSNFRKSYFYQIADFCLFDSYTSYD